MNKKAKEITDESVLQELKDKQQATADAKKVKEVKRLERELKARQKKEEKEAETTKR